MDHRDSRDNADQEMFAEPSRGLDLAHLRFPRWLAERGHLEHRPVGAPSGAFAVRSAEANGQVDAHTAA